MILRDEDIPVLPDDLPVQEDPGLTPEQYDELPKVKEKFAVGYLDQALRAFGLEILTAALFSVESGIADGSLKDVTRGRAWKILEGRARRLADEAAIADQERLRRNALVQLLESGHAYTIGTGEGAVRLRWESGIYYVEGRAVTWVTPHYLAKTCRLGGWKVEPHSEAGFQELRRYRMFRVGGAHA